ncbi:nucleotide sugar dehydrogenase [Granulicella sp. 5B5]|uniref:nucleotide sugar dehydrogenase n=1 Tax=Granulicella sp. 5B5 TaxID=1617967 RepID=UPI0015F64CF3|nr:nucleotide sugar dehydrogenase [Granulicella sp. 5B5]QMV18915.1 nucleotide sugar dehydrogenase [Granulicella sp. 5B5]
MARLHTLAEWIERVESRQTHIAIIGLGYVGLPLTLLFSEAGFHVTGFDIDQKKVGSLNDGISYIHRIPSADIAAARAAGFTATTDFALLQDCDAVLICVPTPLGVGTEHEHEPDLSYVQSTVEAVAPHTHPGQLIVLESTTYPGTTTELVLPILERLGPTPVHRETAKEAVISAGDSSVSAPLSTHCLLAFSPEREDPGNTTTPRHAIPKVVGGTSPTATAAAAALYGAIFDRTVSMSSPDAAEMTKLLENIYRSVNIALVNELKQLCLAMGIDIWEVIDAASTKPFGFQPFYPGPGIGGHCIPVDPFYLSWRAKQFNQPTRFIELAGEVNESMPAFVVETIRKALGSLEGKRVLILGIAYKRDVDDLRESPALTLFGLLQHAGAHVAYNDPYFPQVGIGRHYALQTASTPLTEVPTFDCVLLATDHSAYDIPALVAASKLFIDTRNATRGLTAPNIIRC